ncbi:MAG: hypothetical protein ACN4GT_12320 [Gammaproteobacteria bacterium]
MLKLARNAFVAPATALLLTACATTSDPLESNLDKRSGLTVANLQQVIVLAHPVPGRTTAARDYAYLGPIEINRMGQREHYLWVGMASTLDRKFFSDGRPTPTTLQLLLDGSPMTLPLTAWDDDMTTAPYTVSAPVQAQLRARVSLDQLEHIAKADSVEVRFVARPTASDRYELWGGDWSELATFAEAVKTQP